MAYVSPYHAAQRKERKAKNSETIGIWLMIVGFGTFACMAWSGSNAPTVIIIAMLGMLAGVIGINVALEGRDRKREAALLFDALAAADIRYKDMKEDSQSRIYKDTIKKLFKED